VSTLGRHTRAQWTSQGVLPHDRTVVVRGGDGVAAASDALLDQVLSDHPERDRPVVVLSGVVIDAIHAG